jgi:hypothetical protein
MDYPATLKADFAPELNRSLADIGCSAENAGCSGENSRCYARCSAAVIVIAAFGTNH